MRNTFSANVVNISYACCSDSDREEGEGRVRNGEGLRKEREREGGSERGKTVRRLEGGEG